MTVEHQGTLFKTVDRDEDWRKFHEANPRVYREFKRIAFDLIHAGNAAYISARMVGETIRCQALCGQIKNTDGQPFKLNDHWWPRYARLFMRQFPEHDGVFKTRGRNR